MAQQACPACNQVNRSSARFCARCGRPLTEIQRRALRSGELLKGGEYQVLSRLSRGGMGAVYLVRDKKTFDRPCVIKEMLDYYDASDPQARVRAEARFAEEARTLASLSHPGIPKIYSFFEEDGRYYIVMEYIRGENLEKYVTHEDDVGQIVPRASITEEEILSYAVQVCGILEYLADQPRPVVHQDIKPANLIREQVVGDVRLVDFGTARSRYLMTGPLTQGVAASPRSSVYGTMGYAAPEQWQGAAVPRSDVYSLAATIYHLLTDDDPRDHPGQFPRLAKLRPDLQAALEQALRPDPADRSSARQLRQALEAIVTPHRVVEHFAFPGGERIRSISGIPTMADKYWRASCDYLYGGDFARWFRDMNRLDLVELVQSTCARFRDRDAGLEAFLHRLDPGLSDPQVAVEPAVVDLGRVAQEGECSATLRLRNVGRGYARAHLRPQAAWLRTRPQSASLWAGQPDVPVELTVRAAKLPLFGDHRAPLLISAGRAGRVTVPVHIRLSLWRELCRQMARGWRGALAGADEGLRRAVRRVRRGVGRALRALQRHARLALYGYLFLGIGSALGGWWFSLVRAWADYALVVLFGPALLALVLGLVSMTLTFSLGALAGAVRGVWQTFASES